MKSEKVDYSRFSEDEIIDDGGIEMAFRLKPVPVYLVSRHGRFKKCLSRNAAINTLGHFMTQKVFTRGNRSSRHADVKIENNGLASWKVGEVRDEYWAAHNRCTKRIKKILAKKRAIDVWKLKHDKWMEQYRELSATKPF